MSGSQRIIRRLIVAGPYKTSITAGGSSRRAISSDLHHSYTANVMPEAGATFSSVGTKPL